MTKIFIVSLPRTGTTSLCAALLNCGYKVAHTAYTRESFERAEVIADTPVYCDFKKLDQLYPNSKFIYLDRDINAWLPSIKLLLAKIEDKLDSQAKGMNSIFTRCIKQVFYSKDSNPTFDNHYLRSIYQGHRSELMYYFSSRPHELFVCNLENKNAFEELLEFLGCESEKELKLPHLNKNGRIFDWDSIKHRNKISSHERLHGKRIYFDMGSREFDIFASR